MNSIQISGGIDSLAMLFHLKPRWNDSIVMWGDSSAAYPETYVLMARIKAMVPRFRAVRSNQPDSIAQYGIPVDVVPVKYSRQGEMAFGPQPVQYQSYLDCCSRVLWAPMQRACLAMGIDTIYRGQRSEDERKAPIRTGHVDEFGIRHVFPLEGWTRKQVMAFCEKECPDLIPDYYRKGETSSRDCWDCTAYRNENQQRVCNLPSERRIIVEARLKTWQTLVRQELAYDERSVA